MAVLVATVGLTGGGASRLFEHLGGDSVKSDEFTAWGAGARELLRLWLVDGRPRGVYGRFGTGMRHRVSGKTSSATAGACCCPSGDKISASAASSRFS